MTYSFTVLNSGNTTLTGVGVNDPLLGGAITCTPTTLAPGATATCGPVNYTVTAPDVLNGQVDNTATATGTPPSGPPVIDTDTVSTPTTAPTITVSKASNPASGTSVVAGQTITYTLTAVVADVALATNLVLSDNLGTGQTYVAGSAAGAGWDVSAA
ncbi:hypothetical protein FBQ98_08825, partial [Gammaproteobacteria bacterium PRO6]|nr:hypothetical protein [Gammaproteobacteria bacterium PRO6]